MPNKNYKRASDEGRMEIEQRLRRRLMGLSAISQLQQGIQGPAVVDPRQEGYHSITPLSMIVGGIGDAGPHLGGKVSFTSGIENPGGLTPEQIQAWADSQKYMKRAGSMIGMMSGDAGADIGEARRMAGSSPMDEYVSPTYKAEHPEWGVKQEQRMQEYNTRVGKELAGVTGLDVPYDPTSGGREQREIEGFGITEEQAGNRQAWLEAKRKFDEMMKRLLGRG